MALKNLCTCGAVSVGASSCLAGAEINNNTAVDVFPDGASERVAIDSEGSFWLSTNEDHIVKRCDNNWSCTDVIGDWDKPNAMSVVGDGSTVYVQELNAGPNGEGQPNVKKCDRDEDGSYSCAVLYHDYPSKLAIDAQGSLFSVRSGGMFGTKVLHWTPQLGSRTVGPDCTAHDIAVDLNGNLFVACEGASVMKCTLPDDCLEVYPQQDSWMIKSIPSISVGSGGYLYAYEYLHDGGKRLTRCSPDGDCEHFSITSSLLGDYADLTWSMTVDQKGDVYVTASFFSHSGVFQICLPAPSPGPAPSPSAWQIQSTLSSLCVDLPGGDTSNGALLWTWDCYGGETQQWSFQDGQIVYLPDTSKCVDLLGGDTTNGNTLGLWDCYQGDSQLWGFDPDFGTIYLASSKATDATKCAQIGGKNVGDPLVIWDCDLNLNQLWSLGPALDTPSSFVV